MNNYDEKWKCPNCDTFNTGKRCIVCGQKKIDFSNTAPGKIKSTFAEENKKEHKTMFYVLIGIIAVLLTATVILCVNLIKKDEVSDATPQSKREETFQKTEDKKEEQKESKDEKFVTEYVFGKSLRLDAEPEEIDPNPGFTEKVSENITYVYPQNFQSIGGHRYMPSNQSAFLSFGYDKSETEEDVNEPVSERKAVYKNDVFCELTDDGGYVIISEDDKVRYYEKGLVSNNRTVFFVLAYPVVYGDVYKGYIKELEKGLKLPEEGGVVVIEE